nr:hypothetical protein [Gammaproteobacteria bacterium]
MAAAHPFGASLQLFKIVRDDFVDAVRLATPALPTFLNELLMLGEQDAESAQGR